MKENRIFYANALQSLKELIEEIKDEFSNNLNISNERFIESCKALDDYFVAIKNNFLKNYKNVRVMKELVLWYQDVLNNDVKVSIKKLEYAV